ncbi:MAG: zinc-dependent alcohol dehydrogenase family protein [Gammaproteobacteria bacterium]|nr:zinc-dependent alcohol dehydrogenase family protein [Gammaproteobacteria bacterium]
MHAMVMDDFGEPDVFRQTELPRPEVPAQHVLIRVAASSVNPVDTKIRQGKLAAIAPTRPAILHGDVAGTIEAIGAEVEGLAVGDEVYACAGGVNGRQGALADFMLAEAALAAHAPQSIPLNDAAALPLVSITAWEALIDKARVQAGQKVLVFGGTGGVGHIGVQLAKWRGASVVATCSSKDKAEQLTMLGIEDIANYREESLDDIIQSRTGGQGFDVVFDTVGGENLQKAFAAARLNGTIVTTAARSTQDLSQMHAKGLSLHAVFMLIPMLHNIGTSHHGEILRQIASLVDDDQLRPLLDSQQFRFADVSKAHAYLESGLHSGKIILKHGFD